MVNWQTSGDSMGLAEMLALLNRLRGHASALGCRINPSSRVAIFERNLRRFSKPGYDPRRDADFDPAILAHGTRDVRELTFICDKLVPKDRAKVRTALPDLLSGSITGEGRNQTARNLQFELFIAAQLAHSGFTVTLEEPDMVFVHEGTSLAVAAKRVVSGRQVVSRVREGVQQLARVGDGGLIALSLDRLIPAENPYVVAGGEQGLDSATETLLDETFRPFAPAVHQAIARTTITGLVSSLTVVGFVRVPWQPAHATRTLWMARDDHLPEESGLVRRIVEVLWAPSDP